MQVTNQIRSWMMVVIVGLMAMVAMGYIEGSRAAMGAGVGALVGVVNWLATSLLTRRVLSRQEGSSHTIGGLLVVKMGLLLAVCWVLIGVLRVHPVGFLVGVTSVILGSGFLLSRPGQLKDSMLTAEKGR